MNHLNTSSAKRQILKHTIGIGKHTAYGRERIEKVLDLLSGDLNYNNVASAKKILKDLLSHPF